MRIYVGDRRPSAFEEGLGRQISAVRVLVYAVNLHSDAGLADLTLAFWFLRFRPESFALFLTVINETPS